MFRESIAKNPITNIERYWVVFSCFQASHFFLYIYTIKNIYECVKVPYLVEYTLIEYLLLFGNFDIYSHICNSSLSIYTQAWRVKHEKQIGELKWPVFFCECCCMSIFITRLPIQSRKSGASRITSICLFLYGKYNTVYLALSILQRTRMAKALCCVQINV